MSAAIWPLFDLAVTTPRLSLSYVTDEVGAELAGLAAAGIHDPATMPFSEPWTDIAPPELQRNSLRYFWHCRSTTTVENWTLNLAARDNAGEVVGLCSVTAEQFPATHTATTGSWLGRAFQGRGLGTEIRHAALHLIFGGLGAEVAATRAWHDNAASLAVTRSLPYTEGSPLIETRRDHADTMLTFTMRRVQWEMVRRNDITLSGLASTREFLEVSGSPWPPGSRRSPG